MPAVSQFCFPACLLVMAVAVPSAGAQPDSPPQLPVEAVKKAAAIYDDVYGAEHARLKAGGKLTEKADFAKRLVERARGTSGDLALASVLLAGASEFVRADAPGARLSSEAWKLVPRESPSRGGTLARFAAAMEKGIPGELPDARGKLAADLTDLYVALAKDEERDGKLDDALATVGKARVVARTYLRATEFKERAAAIEAGYAKLKAAADDAADLTKLKAAVKAAPNDANANLALAAGLLARQRIDEAVPALKAGGAVALGAELSKDKAARDDLRVAAAAVAAADPLPEGGNKLSLLQFACRHYELAIPTVDPAKREGVVEDYSAVLEKVLQSCPAAARAEVTATLVGLSLDRVEDAIAARDAARATKLHARLKSLTATLRSGDPLLAEVEAVGKEVKSLSTAEAEFERWQKKYEASPADPTVCLGLALCHVRAGRLADAAPLLRASGNKPLAALGELLKADPKGGGARPDPLTLGDTCRTAAAELKGDDRAALLSYAREAYEVYLASPASDPASKTRVQLLVAELPPRPAAPSRNRRAPAGVIVLFDENPEFVKLLADKHSGGAGKASLESKDVFLGRSAIKVTANYVEAKAAGWAYEVVEKPTKPNQVRYAAFAWKKVGGGTSHFVFFDSAGGGHAYTAGKGVVASETLLDKSPPAEWKFEVRDLFADAKTKDGFTIAGISVAPIDGDYLLLDAVFLSPNREPLERFSRK